MTRAVFGLLWLAIGCTDETEGGAGVTVLQCDGVTDRSLIDVGLPPSPKRPIEMIPTRQGSCAGGWAAVLTVDAQGSNGELVLVSMQTLGVREEPRIVTTGDAVARHIDGRLYVLNRFGFDSIQVYDVENDFSQVGEEFAVGDGTTNIQDICCSNRQQCYVPRLDHPSVAIINPEGEDDESRMLGSIDLSGLDEDGNPNAAGCYLSGSRLAIALQRLDALYSPQTPGQIAFYDVTSDPPQLLSVMDTAAPNPFTRFVKKSTGTALIGEVGRFGVMDGVLEVVDLESRSTGGTLLTEEDLEGDLVDFVNCTTGQTWAIAAASDGDTRLHAVDLAIDDQPGNARPARISTDGWRLTGLSADLCGRIWVADRDVPNG